MIGYKYKLNLLNLLKGEPVSYWYVNYNCSFFPQKWREWMD